MLVHWLKPHGIFSTLQHSGPEMILGLNYIGFCFLGKLFLIHQMRIQITIHYLRSGQEASPGVRASASAGKAAVPTMRPSREGLKTHPLGFFYPLCCKSVDTFDSLTDFNSRSTLWNGTLINPEDISSSLPVVPHCTGTVSVTSRSQKLEKHTLPPLSNKDMCAWVLWWKAELFPPPLW